MGLSEITLATILGLAAISFFGWRLLSRRYALPCPAWLSFLVEMDNPLFESTRATTVVANLGLGPGMRVLDAGCGPGRLTMELAKAVGPSGSVVAIDIQQRMLTRVREKALRAGVANIDCRQGALGAGAIAGEMFDRAVLSTVLGEIPDRKAALKEIYAALRRGGVLAISETIADPHYQRRSTVRDIAQSVGFRETRLLGGRFAYTLYLEKP